MIKDAVSHEERTPLFKYYKSMGGILKFGQEEQQQRGSLFDERIDGGYGWIITAGAFLCHFQATGISFSW
ncbi:hypothetical protein O0I10_007740 [Lichtheimia ornata]|uniref:Uncharacterized protein n=1 Tax=Lichtheimia ornata TaxID=688661 RepID=A0AAD7XXN8_9FUNG|nr:uncharacterized protein O0I10_007740 [Lichtheimia ornata]KAJ8656661.1 hypothetical protein O0I10_007740 [Lichtheimia ornata]